MIKLESDRLIIRDHIKEDLSGLHRLLSDRQVMRYLPDIYCRTKEESIRNLNLSITEAGKANRQKYFFAIIHKKQNYYIGETGFTLKTETAEDGIGALGYFILEKYWGQGFAGEAVNKLLDFAFLKLGMHKIICGCIKENKASHKVMLRCGFVKEADFRQHIRHENRWKDRLEYAWLKTDWLQDKRRAR